MIDAVALIACLIAGFVVGVTLCMMSMGKRHTDMIKQIDTTMRVRDETK